MAGHRGGSSRVKLFFDDDGFDGELQRSVGKCDSGMANVGECLYIASQITPGDRDSWYRQWSAFADRLAGQADAALAAGHTVSAAGCYLRACRVLPPGVLLAPRRPRRHRAHDRVRAPAWPRSAAALPAARPPGCVLDGEPPVTSSLRPATGRSRRSSTSAATTAPPRRSTRRRTQPLDRGLGVRRLSTVPARHAASTTA